MSRNRSSLKPIEGANRAIRRRLTLKGENNLVLFGLAVGMTALLVALERFTLWVLARNSTS